MFGYVRVQRDDLKIKEFRTYKEKYCGLCQTLGKRMGMTYRLLTNYDIVFLILCLENFVAHFHTINFRCPLNPLNRKTATVSPEIMEYGAFVNYYLALLKLDDDEKDERKNSKKRKIALKILLHNKKYAVQQNKIKNEIMVLEHLMSKLNQLEKSKADFDSLINCFGNYFAEIFSLFFKLYNYKEPEKYDDFYKMCFYLGEWIYIMDAYDDYTADIKKNNFNLLSGIMEEDFSENKIIAHRKIYIINKMILLKINYYFEQIEWKINGNTIKNIITVGCNGVFQRILHNKYPLIEKIIIKGNQ